MTAGILALLLTLGVGATPPDVYTMRNQNLEIPIRVNDAKRAEIKELELHVSTDMGRTWTLSGRATPDQRAFGFHARGDGLYWFAVCAIDKNNHRDPEDIATAPPALKVLIDTAHPALQVVAIDRVGEEVQVAWECSDTQADAASLKLEYRPAGAEPTAVWTPVSVPAQINGTYRFRPIHGGAITLRMQITDSAGSPATVIKDVPAGAVAAVPPPVTTAMSPAPVAAPPMVPPAVPAPAIQQANSVAPPPVPPPAAPLAAMPSTVAAPPTMPEAPPPMPAASSPIVPPTTVDAPAGPPALAPLRPASEPVTRPATAPAMPDMTSPSTATTHVSPAEVQHVHDKQVAIDFDVDRKGPSGVKKIEVYVTQDDGQSWFKYSESMNTTPPLQLDLPPRDGLYGFCMVLYSGVGQSEGPPRAGDAPHFRVLVDRTIPQVMLYEPVLDPTQANALIVRYKAADANLVPGSVALYWKSRPEQPWQPLSASSPKPSAQFAGVQECTWSLPPDVPNSVYLRVTARDQAGNVGEFVTRDAVMVDLNKPVARVKAVVPAGYRRP
jgi:hypothetical protein